MELFHKLTEYAVSDNYPFHMPGHKRNAFLSMKSPYYYDITEIDGFDNLHEAEDILARGMEESAGLFHTRQTYYLVNGSTCGLLTAIFASTNQGDTILMARNCHKSVYNAVMLRELRPVYLYPEMTGDYSIAGSVTVSQVEKALKEHPKVAAVVITSPSYDGVMSDIASIAKVVHLYGKILIVDEAHGAHLPFHSSFPESAIEGKADLVIHSVHKTLPSLTQTALLHRVSDRVDQVKIKKYLSIFQTSSPSYILMSSIEQCIEFLEDSTQAFEDYINLLNEFYTRTRQLRSMEIWKPQKSERVFDKDPSKILICAKDSDISGVWIYQKLLEEYHIQCEMVSKDYVVCLTSVCDTKQGFDRLICALEELDQGITSVKRQSDEFMVLKNELVLCPGQVEGYNTKKIALTKSEGYISSEFIYLYPPGIPILVPGERISRKLLEQIKKLKASGLLIKGLQDPLAQIISIIDEESI